MELLAEFIHAQGWCLCSDSDGKMAVWSAANVEYSVDEADNLIKADTARRSQRT